MLTVILAVCMLSSFAQADEYNPLESTQEVTSEVFTLVDASRKREIPVRYYFPEQKGPRPVVLFSHGLGGSRDNNGYIGKHLAGRGYVCVFMQHPGSDESVWRGKGIANVQSNMQKAANGENLKLRGEDVKAVVEALSVWNTTKGHPLEGRVDTTRIGMSGHSFGAQTTQAALGQNYGPMGQKFSVPEIRAGVAYSPSIPRIGDENNSFSKMDRPMLLMTGTEDESPIGGQTAESRRKVYPALPNTIDRYELVLDGGQHSAFSEREIRLRAAGGGAKNPNHHRVILALTTAFWDAYLLDDATAKAWLQGDGPRQIMEKADVWQFATKK
ncbi:alpha/beta hydrolase family protein [Lacunimicrobium album]